jgi:hypothetical protein
MKLNFLKEQLKDIENVNELNMFYMANERKYWWVNFFITGLYQAMNGKIKYILIAYLLCWTIIVPFIMWIYCLINGHSDQNEFNFSLQLAISKRRKEIKEGTNEENVRMKKLNTN